MGCQLLVCGFDPELSVPTARDGCEGPGRGKETYFKFFFVLQVSGSLAVIFWLLLA